MNITNFDDLLQAARQQLQGQRLLFVFASAELPEDSTPAQKARFLAGQGGTLEPVMCLDRTPAELTSFAALAEEANQFGKPWSLVFISTMSGTDHHPPVSSEADQPLQRMVDSVKAGTLANMIPLDAQGLAVALS